MIRITAAVPEALIPDGNQLAMAIGLGPADGQTYVIPNWQDADGNRYAAASFEARPEWVEAAQQPLVRPAWDTDEIIDMDAASRAQAAMVFSTEPVAATPGQITAIGGMPGLAALAAMGLTAVEADDAD
jgi:hypothetical protein